MLTKTQNREKTIEQWMLTIVSDGGVLRFDDLHIDKIDPGWALRMQWIEGGLEALRIGLVVRDRNQLPFTVGLGFSLEAGSRPIDVDFEVRGDLQEKFDWSPPSLYLFKRGEEPDKQGVGVVRHLDPEVFGLEVNTRFYYLEFKQDGADEYCRSVFIEG
jgi:hypothetical protein